MSQLFLLRAVSAIFFLLISSIAVAQTNDPCGCNAGLVSEVSAYSGESSISLAYLKQIDEKQYERLKREGSMEGSYFEVIGGSADYSDFQEKRQEYLSSLSFSLDAEESISMVLESVKTDDWVDCKKACIESQLGFNCGLFDLTTNTVGVRCSWQHDGNAKKRKVFVVANMKDQPVKFIGANTIKDWHFQRNRSTDLLLTFTPRGGSSSSVKVAATPEQLPSNTLSKTVSTTFNIYGKPQSDGSREGFDLHDNWLVTPQETYGSEVTSVEFSYIPNENDWWEYYRVMPNGNQITFELKPKQTVLDQFEPNKGQTIKVTVRVTYRP